MIDKCVICGDDVPEGRQICPKCENTYKGERNMTEREARVYLSNEIFKGNFTADQMEALKVLLEELYELATYRAIGTVEEFATAKKG